MTSRASLFAAATPIWPWEPLHLPVNFPPAPLQALAPVGREQGIAGYVKPLLLCGMAVGTVELKSGIAGRYTRRLRTEDYPVLGWLKMWGWWCCPGSSLSSSFSPRSGIDAVGISKQT